MKITKFKNTKENLFFQSLRIRLVEEKIIELYPQDKIQSPVHLSIGQEAIAVGVCMNLRKQDLIFTTYRGHAFYLAKGGDLKKFFAELYGKKTGISEGIAGSMHLTAPEVGMMGSSAIVASTIPHGIGAAYAAKKLKKDQIITIILGDGACEEGTFHESLNFVALHELPVIFVVENNRLAVNAKIEKRQSFKIFELARQYKGIDSTFCHKGYNPLEVHKTFGKVIDQLKKRHTPQLIEIPTFRYKEHVGIKDENNPEYRSLKDFQEWQQKDPLIKNKYLTKKFLPYIIKEIDEAINFAEKSPWPDPRDLTKNII